MQLHFLRVDMAIIWRADMKKAIDSYTKALRMILDTYGEMMPMQLPVKTVQWCWRRRDFQKKQESSGKGGSMQEKGVLQWK